MDQKHRFALIALALTSGCDAGLSGNSAERSSSGAGAVCTSSSTQLALRDLIKSRLEDAVRGGAGTGQFNGDHGLLQLASIRMVGGGLNKITFTDTIVASSEAAGTECSTGLWVQGATADAVKPRLSFRVQTTVEDGGAVVSLKNPLEVDAAIQKLVPAFTSIDTASRKPVSDVPKGGSKARDIFKCSFGQKQVAVTLAGNRLTYQFGPSGAAELTLSGDHQSGNVLYVGGFGSLDYSVQLRFVNNATSYVLTESGLTSDFNAGDPGEAMLIVIENGKRVARMVCKKGGGFFTVEPLVDFPEDEFLDEE